jgi:hypothetical protein
MTTRRRRERGRGVHEGTGTTTESEEDVIDHGVVRGTESGATDTEIIHGRATGRAIMVAMTGADTDHEATTTSDEKIIRSAGVNAMSM